MNNLSIAIRKELHSWLIFLAYTWLFLVTVLVWNWTSYYACLVPYFLYDLHSLIKSYRCYRQDPR